MENQWKVCLNLNKENWFAMLKEIKKKKFRSLIEI